MERISVLTKQENMWMKWLLRICGTEVSPDKFRILLAKDAFLSNLIEESKNRSHDFVLGSLRIRHGCILWHNNNGDLNMV